MMKLSLSNLPKTAQDPRRAPAGNQTRHCADWHDPRTHHWHTKISNHLTQDFGFRAMDQEKCVFSCEPFADKPPICIGLSVDDFIHHSKSDEVEQWFENELEPMSS